MFASPTPSVRVLADPDPMARLRRLAFLLLGIGTAFLALLASSRLWVEWEWFRQLGFADVVARRWLIQAVTFLVVMGLGVPLQLQQMGRCWNLRLQAARKTLRPLVLLRMRGRPYLLVMGLVLLLLAGGLTYLIVQANDLITDPFSGDVISGLPVLGDLPLALWLGLTATLLIPMLLWPHNSLRVALTAALAGSATALARGWSLWLPALLAQPFGELDPVIGLDLSFTVLQLPALRLLLSVLIAQVIVGLAACLWLTLTEADSLSELTFPGLSREQQQVLQPQLAVLALLVALGTALAPFNLMVFGSGVASGAGFVDLHVRLPLRLLLSLLLLLTAMGLLVPLPRHWLRRGLLVPLLGTIGLVPVTEWLVAPLVQRLWVQPRELAVEGPYLGRTIRGTRRAFGLESVKEIILEPRQKLTSADLASAPGTLANVRLWDSTPLLATNRQLQQLRLYYSFPSAAVDRYPLSADPKLGSQQVLISARELDSSALAAGSRTWLNRHLIFTHGYGFTISAVNAAGPDGLPLYLVKDLGRSGQVQGLPKLGLSTDQVRRALPVGRPRLYFGSARAPYAIAPSLVQEFDYPDGELNVYTHYQGNGGVPVGQPLQRLMAALYLGEARLLFTGALTPQSRLLMRRQVNQRLAALAPFLRFESQPYLVTARINNTPGFDSDQHQYWLLDGFTTSRSYPYSDPNPAGIRYFRNPVKAVVDAHNGSIRLYVSDSSDPILRTWQRVFPELFKPLSAMPTALMRHIQVPQSQFQVQAERLLRFHVTNVRTFYNGDDVWSIPTEIYGSKTIPVLPYQAELQLPGQKRPEFVLLVPFSPLGRANLVGWLAARNDAPNYGSQLLVRFPLQRLLLGPQQISALIEQDPAISYQFGLWNRAGSEVIHGNLLVLPVGRGLLYVEPIYLRSRNSNLPSLVRVVVTDGVTFVMERNLETALNKLAAATPATAADVGLKIPE